ncbi:hypothetical protein SNEBB_000277 [Seison nebaliae]|nr:hypothetical protein SNEBB_000277 [Seison nebaliae]
MNCTFGIYFIYFIVTITIVLPLKFISFSVPKWLWWTIEPNVHPSKSMSFIEEGLWAKCVSLHEQSGTEVTDDHFFKTCTHWTGEFLYSSWMEFDVDVPQNAPSEIYRHVVIDDYLYVIQALITTGMISDILSAFLLIIIFHKIRTTHETSLPLIKWMIFLNVASIILRTISMVLVEALWKKKRYDALMNFEPMNKPIMIYGWAFYLEIAVIILTVILSTTEAIHYKVKVSEIKRIYRKKIILQQVTERLKMLDNEDIP